MSLLCLGLCRSVERLSVSDVDIDDGLSLALAQMTACYAIISETNLHCSHLVALSASGASACAASTPTKRNMFGSLDSDHCRKLGHCHRPPAGHRRNMLAINWIYGICSSLAKIGEGKSELL